MSSPGSYKAIVMGTSAGGLHALMALLTELPQNYGLPIIIVQHRAKDVKHLLEDILQQKCRINIKQADEKEKIQNGTVYIAPPDYHLFIERDHTLSLSSDPQVSYSRPSIDVLFESAALVYRSSLIGILLTGANSDGTAGLDAIKKHGGLTVAQSPQEALFPFMPQAAIDRGVAMRVLSLAEIHTSILQHYAATP